LQVAGTRVAHGQERGNEALRRGNAISVRRGRLRSGRLIAVKEIKETVSEGEYNNKDSEDQEGLQKQANN
jgi:hypothetical protein